MGMIGKHFKTQWDIAQSAALFFCFAKSLALFFSPTLPWGASPALVRSATCWTLVWLASSQIHPRKSDQLVFLLSFCSKFMQVLFFCVYLLIYASLKFTINYSVILYVHTCTGLLLYVLLASSCGRVQGNSTICFSQRSQEQGAYPSFALLLLGSSYFIVMLKLVC